MVSKLDREKLICYKEKNEFCNKNTIFFKFPYDLNFIDTNRIIVESFNNIKNDYEFLKDKKLKIVNYIQPNIGRLLVHNFSFNFDHFKLFNYFKCSKLDCTTCQFGNRDYFIRFNDNFYLPICQKSSCDSKGIVYVIKCKLCKDVFYIGQSGRTIKDRLLEHLRDIKNFKPFYNYKNVSFHFNLLGHNYLDHFSFFIIINNVDDKYTRIYFERFMIYIFNLNNIKLLNDRNDVIMNFDFFKNLKFKNFLNFGDKPY